MSSVQFSSVQNQLAAEQKENRDHSEHELVRKVEILRTILQSFSFCAA